MNPLLVQRIQAMIAAGKAAGYEIMPGSGYRSYEEQAKLYADYRAGKPGQARAAPPGRSNHNHGLAMDLRYGSDAARAWANAHAGEFGLRFPMGDEPWHVELGEGADTAGFVDGAQQMGAVGFDVNWIGAQMSPEEAQDALMSGYMDAMVGAQRDALAQVATPTDPALATPAAPEIASPSAEPSAQMPLPEQRPVPEGSQSSGTGAGGTGAGGWSGNIPPPGYNPPGDGVERWRDVAVAALRYTGQDPALVDVLLRRMGQESSGNPMAVNNWDSNAQRGDPSKGLMQNIGSAFPSRARELAGRGIFDGFANIVASIRYTLSRYGDLSKGWGRPGGY